MKQLVGICGSGLIGYDPFDRRTWSGSSYFLFSALQARGAVRRAFGVEADRWRKLLHLALNFRFNRRLWRENFYLDTGYYNALTAAIRRQAATQRFRVPSLATRSHLRCSGPGRWADAVLLVSRWQPGGSSAQPPCTAGTERS